MFMRGGPALPDRPIQTSDVMKINGNEIRPGNIIEHDGGLWVAVKTAHVKPGKGGAFAQVELTRWRRCGLTRRTSSSSMKLTAS
jgi:translation elongation factor P/translation initiation factor 5A